MQKKTHDLGYINLSNFNNTKENGINAKLIREKNQGFIIPAL